jgi:hypothetical protein
VVEQDEIHGNVGGHVMIDRVILAPDLEKKKEKK